MSATLQQLEDFVAFAKRELANGGADLSIDDLFDRWRGRTDDEVDPNEVAAIEASIADYDRGERGVPVEQHLEEVRREFDLR